MPVAARGLVITGGAILTVKISVAVPVAPLVVTLRVTLYGLPASVPAAGVPEITPVLVLTLKPVGSPAAL